MKKIFIAMFAFLVLLSCSKNETVDQATNGNLEVTLDISSTSLSTATTFLIFCNGEQVVHTASQGSITFDLTPDVYDLHIVNQTSDYSFEIVDGALIATVNQDESGNTEVSPSALYYGYLSEIILESESQHEYTATISKITSNVSITMNVSSGEQSAISSLSTSLSGIASSWDCTNSKAYGDAATIYPDVNSSSLSGSITLLGTNGSEQIFTYTYNETDDMSGNEEFAKYLYDINTSKEDVDIEFSVSAPTTSTQGGVIDPREENDNITEEIK